LFEHGVALGEIRVFALKGTHARLRRLKRCPHGVELSSAQKQARPKVFHLAAALKGLIGERRFSEIQLVYKGFRLSELLLEVGILFFDGPAPGFYLVGHLGSGLSALPLALTYMLGLLAQGARLFFEIARAALGLPCRAYERFALYL
jgi:hypothetical protein